MLNIVSRVRSWIGLITSIVSIAQAGSESAPASPHLQAPIQQVEVPLSFETWLQRKEPTYRVPIAVSRDGRWLAVMMQGVPTEGTKSNSTLPNEGGLFEVVTEEVAGSEIWIIERSTGKVTRPFARFAASYAPVWSPDGTRLAFLAQDSPVRYPRVALWSPGEAEPRVFIDAPCRATLGFSAPIWSPSGTQLIFNRQELRESHPQRLARTVIDEQGAVLQDTVSKITAAPAVLDLASGAVRAYKRFDYPFTTGIRLSRDGRRVAYLLLTEAPANGVVANWVQLTILSLDDGSVQTVGAPQPDGWGLGLSWSPDGRRIAWRAVSHGAPEKLLVASLDRQPVLQEIALPPDAKEGYLLDIGNLPPAPPLWMADGAGFWITGKNSLLHFDADGQRLGDLPLPAGPSLGGIDWLDNAAPVYAPLRTQAAPASDEVYVLRRRAIHRVNLRTLSVQTVLDLPKTIGAGLTRNWTERAVDWTTSTLFTLRSTGERGTELLQTSLENSHTSRAVLLNPGFGSVSYGKTHALTWKLPDGTTCGGTLLLPINYKPGDRPPVVMEVYGDDRDRGKLTTAAMHEASYLTNPHLLSAQGYAFFVPDMPQTDAEPAASLVLAAEAAADALETSGLVDAKRICVMGQSYGGYTALCILTQSSRFKAGIVSNGLYDLFRIATNDGFSYVEGGQGRMQTTVWADPQRYLKNSPLLALDKLHGALLVIQGGGDRGTNSQGPALLASLIRLRKPAEYLFAPEMAHAPSSWTVETQRELVPRLLAFLDRNLQ